MNAAAGDSRERHGGPLVKAPDTRAVNDQGTGRGLGEVAKTNSAAGKTRENQTLGGSELGFLKTDDVSSPHQVPHRLRNPQPPVFSLTGRSVKREATNVVGNNSGDTLKRGREGKIA